MASQVFAEHAIAGEVGDGRAEAAVGIVTLIAREPVKHHAARVLKHFRFLDRFGDVRGQPPAVLARGFGGQPQ